MVSFMVRGRSAADCANAIQQMHEEVFRNYQTFYMLYPITKRWKLKTKQQHFQSSRMKKGNRFVCNWCDKKSCAAKMNTEEEFFVHVTNHAMRQGRLAFVNENEYRERRGWPAIDEEKNKISAQSPDPASTDNASPSDVQSTGKKRAAKPASGKKAKQAASSGKASGDKCSVKKKAAASVKRKATTSVKRKATASVSSSKRVKKVANEVKDEVANEAVEVSQD